MTFLHHEKLQKWPIKVESKIIIKKHEVVDDLHVIAGQLFYYHFYLFLEI